MHILNGGGAIFGKFEGLKQSAARERLVMAEHVTSACHLCQAHGVAYQNADDMASLREGIDFDKDYLQKVDSLTTDDIRDFCRQLTSTGNRIQVTMK